MAVDELLSTTLFEPVLDWGPATGSTDMGGEATAVAVDSDDNGYVFNRGPIPIVVFDPDGHQVGREPGENLPCSQRN